MLPFRARVDLGIMAMKGCSAFFKAPASLEPHHQIVLCYIQDTRCVLITLLRCSMCILQPQPTWQYSFVNITREQEKANKKLSYINPCLSSLMKYSHKKIISLSLSLYIYIYINVSVIMIKQYVSRNKGLLTRRKMVTPDRTPIILSSLDVITV